MGEPKAFAVYDNKMLIGYVGEVSEADLNNSRFAFYEPGDVVGKSGVEEAYDAVLRGQDGSRDMIVNSHGREVGVMATGQVTGLIDDLPSCAELIDRIMESEA